MVWLGRAGLEWTGVVSSSSSSSSSIVRLRQDRAAGILLIAVAFSNLHACGIIAGHLAAHHM